MKLVPRLPILFFLVIATSPLYSVSGQEQSNLRIGFSIEAMNGERWQTDLGSFETRAKKLGAQVISADAHTEDDRQLQQVQEMMSAGIKALVILPRDTPQESC